MKTSSCIVGAAIMIAGGFVHAQPPAPTPPPDPAPPAPTPAEPPPPTAPPEPVVAPVAPEPPPPDDDKPQTEIKFGGFVMGAAYYDTNSNIVRPWLIRVLGEGDPSFDFDQLPTRVVATSTTKYRGIVGTGHVEVDLKLGDFARLRQVYASVGGDWGSVLIGQAYSLVGGFHFVDSYNMDAFVIQGAAYTRQPTIRYTKAIDKLTLHVAAMSYRGQGGVIVSGAAMGNATVVDQAEVPFLQARAEYAVLGKGFVAVAGAAGQFQVQFTPGMMSSLPAARKDVTALMGAVDVVLPFGKHRFALHGFYSKSGGSSSGIAQAAVVQADGAVDPVTSFGGHVNVVLGLGSGMRVSAFAAVDNPTDKVDDFNLPLERNLVVGALLGKELLPKKLETGISVEYAETKTAADKFDDIRTTLALRYSL